MTQPTTKTSRVGAPMGGPRFVARLRKGTRRAAAIAATGLMLTGAPAAADGFKDAVVQQLVEQGFREFRISRTLLGRTRVIATSKTLRREIIFNPVTGEILRDYWRDKNEGERLIRRAGGESGLRERRAPSLVDPAEPPSATAAIAPAGDPDTDDTDTTEDTADTSYENGDQDSADTGGNLSDGDASGPSDEAGDNSNDGASDADTGGTESGGETGADAGGDAGDASGGESGGEAGGDGGADSGGGSDETPG